MKKHKLLSILLAGAVVFSSVPTGLVFAAPTDDILSAGSSDGQDIIRSGEDDIDITAGAVEEYVSAGDKVSADDTILCGDEVSVDEIVAPANDILDEIGGPDKASDAKDGKGTDGAGDSEYRGYVEPDWVGQPMAVDENLTIGEIDDMVEGEEIAYDENGDAPDFEILKDDPQPDKATIEPISEDDTELPKAFPAAYGSGTDSELEAIDTKLATQITPERRQSPYGTCWAHETIALTEAYKINKQGGNPANINNSERHLVYYTYAEGTNPMGFDTADVAALDGRGEATFLDQGGNVTNAAITLNKWRGVALESQVPYSSIVEGAAWDYEEFLDDGGRLENCYAINIKDNPEMVKRFIRAYGAVGISYYSKSGTSAETDAAYYNAATNAYYCSDAHNTNHGVAVVGWDDDFPLEAFVNKPASNGAWLVRNSWKEGGKVKDKSYSAYFWMSYYDKSLKDTAYAIKMQETEDYSDNNYFYDTQSHKNSVLFSRSGGDIESANVFKVSGSAAHERLDSISLQVFAPNQRDNTGYNVKIYKDLTEPAVPDSGVLIAEKDGDLPFLGIYTISFDDTIILTKDTYFSVVVTVNGGGRTVDIEHSYTSAEGGEIYMCKALDGQSFYRFPGDTYPTWFDVNTINDKPYGNFCISAHTTDITGDVCNVMVYSRTDMSSASFADLWLSAPVVVKGDSVTVIAPDKNDIGYSFIGWYKSNDVDPAAGIANTYEPTRLSDKLEYSFSATEDIDLVAVYKANETTSITINVENGAAFIIGNEAPVANNVTIDDVLIGSKFRLYADAPEKVLCWKNGSGKVIGKGESVLLTVTKDLTVTLVYKVESTEEAYLQFLSDYGQVLSCEMAVKTATSFNRPTPPTKFGYDFVKWVFEGTDVEATDTEIKAKLNALTGVDSVITCVPKYSQKNEEHFIRVYYKNGENIVSSAVIFSDIRVGKGYRLTALPVINNNVFECWKDSSGNELGYDTNYFLLVNGDVELTASYKDVGSQVTPEPIIRLGDLYKTEEGSAHKVCAAATRNIPDGYELIEQGMLYAKNVSAPDTDTFKYGTAGVLRYESSDNDKNGVLYLNAVVSSDDDVISFRGYMKVRNTSTSEEKVFYTEIKSASYTALNTI